MITVVAVSGHATVQDGGRPGHMHEGVPPGGPLVPELLARANAAVGNEDDEAGLELFGDLTLVGTAATLVASDDGVPGSLTRSTSPPRSARPSRPPRPAPTSVPRPPSTRRTSIPPRTAT